MRFWLPFYYHWSQVEFFPRSGVSYPAVSLGLWFRDGTWSTAPFSLRHRSQGDTTPPHTCFSQMDKSVCPGCTPAMTGRTNTMESESWWGQGLLSSTDFDAHVRTAQRRTPLIEVFDLYWTNFFMELQTHVQQLRWLSLLLPLSTGPLWRSHGPKNINRPED